MISSLEQKKDDKHLREKLQDMLSKLEDFDETKENNFLSKEDISINVPTKEIKKPEENLENTITKERVVERTEEKIDNKYQQTSLYQNEARYSNTTIDTTLLHKIEEGLHRRNLIPGDRIFNSENLKDVTNYMENMGLNHKQISRFTKEITGFTLSYEAKDIKGTKDIKMFKDYED
ncbi:MAG: hypothetical protein PHD81_03955 [Candidatus Nanoarchaeia archaeon]|nr:hypothetical protein [Candidatus Nanoarchaeia archaeon]MDD5588235.1 hypothetical protein [Candidatus Nanoarchaeia archaeon]